MAGSNRHLLQLAHRTSTPALLKRKDPDFPGDARPGVPYLVDAVAADDLLASQERPDMKSKRIGVLKLLLAS